MNKTEFQNNRYQEDEIDLRELFKTIVKGKKIIILITLIITLSAVVYALMSPKIYEAKAILKIGEFKLTNTNTNTNTTVTVANALELSKELEILFIDILKNNGDREAKIQNITLPKNQTNFLEITANGFSNKSAQAEIQKVVDYVQESHKKILDDVKKLHEAEAKQIKNELLLLKTKTIPIINEKIKRYKKDIELYEINFFNLQNNLKKIKDINPTLATIQINEQRYLVDILIKLKDSLEEFESKKNNLEVVEIEKLEEEMNSLKVLMESRNYKNTEVVGIIITDNAPINPKKRLIVTVAFVTGLILSIFIVFLLNFFKEEKNKTLSA
ncbi:MAG: Wzz/FepE/Etk N-terminal domain-containing protein [Sulfurimonas sp.]|jgi:LPS O-antigen subunit length determinant protein (WzzB/FepE family)